MPFPFLTKKTERLVGVIDIGGDAVRAGLILLRKEGLPCLEIVKSAQLPLSHRLDSGLKGYLKELSNDLDAVLEKVFKDTDQVPEEFFCTLPSILIHNQTSVISRKEKENFTVTEKEVKEMVANHSINWMKNMDVLFTNLPGDKNVLLETSVIQAKINGYESQNPYKQKAQNLELAVYNSLSSVMIMKMIKGKIDNISHGRKINFSSYPLVLFRVFSDVMPEERSFMILDPSGRLCDIILVDHGVLLAHKSFPLGSQMVAELSDNNQNSSDAWSMLELYAKGKLASQESSKMEKKLESLKNKWAQSFEEALIDMSNYCFTPSRVYIVGDDPLSSIFRKWIQDIGFEGRSLACNPLEGKMLTVDTLSGFCGGKVLKDRDLPLVVGALFARRLYW